MRWRLSVLMFMLYAPLGALMPLYSLRLQELQFTPIEIGIASGTHALAAMIAPLVAGQIADRYIAAERCLAVCSLLGAVLLWILASLTTPLAIIGTSLVFWLIMGPATTLGTAFTFTHLLAPEREFGRVRLWGTISWMTAGWLTGFWLSNPVWLERLLALLPLYHPAPGLADVFQLAGVLAFASGLYALTLPHTPPQRRLDARLAPLAALGLLRNRSFAVYWASSFLVCVTLPFTIQAVPLFLEHLGIPRPLLAPILTLGQVVEILALGVLPMLLLRLGTRGTMILGLVAWAVYLIILTIGSPLWLVIGSLPLAGLCICCFIVAGQVFVNGKARGDIRASTQALLSFSNGFGMLTGNLLIGWVRWLVGQDFRATFAVGAVIGTLLLVGFLVGFQDDSEAPVLPAPGPPEHDSQRLAPAPVPAHAPSPTAQDL